MEYLLNCEVAKPRRQEIVEDLLKEFCNKEVLPHQSKTVKKISILNKLRVSGIDEQELDQLVCELDIDAVSESLKCYHIRKDYQAGIEAIRRIGREPKYFVEHGCLLQNLRKFHVKLAETKRYLVLEDFEKVRSEFSLLV